MSSLLQFNGRITQKGVHLQFIQEEVVLGTTKDTDGIFMPSGRFYARIWTAVRKPVGMFGCWVVFRYLGEEHVPDLSCPISVPTLPRGAQPLTNDECVKAWHS